MKKRNLFDISIIFDEFIWRNCAHSTRDIAYKI